MNGHITMFLSLRPPIPVLAVLTDIFIAGRVSATAFPAVYTHHTRGVLFSDLHIYAIYTLSLIHI